MSETTYLLSALDTINYCFWLHRLLSNFTEKTTKSEIAFTSEFLTYSHGLNMTIDEK